MGFLRQRRRAWGIGAALVALGSLSPRSADAQTCPNITFNLGSTEPRFYSDEKTPYPFIRPQNLDPTAINYKDCADDITIEFTLLIGNLPCTDTVQVWAGTTDCTQTTA